MSENHGRKFTSTNSIEIEFFKTAINHDTYNGKTSIATLQFHHIVGVDHRSSVSNKKKALYEKGTMYTASSFQIQNPPLHWPIWSIKIPNRKHHFRPRVNPERHEPGYISTKQHKGSSQKEYLSIPSKEAYLVQ